MVDENFDVLDEFFPRLDAATLKLGMVISGSLSKGLEVKLDPSAPSFRPKENRQLFFNDILGNATVVDLMANLMENRRGEAIGLAFDGTAAQSEESTAGFEFRFYRGPDSHGWSTDQFGGAAYTVSNVRLDVRPVKIQGPLYK